MQSNPRLSANLLVTSVKTLVNLPVKLGKCINVSKSTSILTHVTSKITNILGLDCM